uniref:hypothetical protein n=1 Tax=Cochlodiniinecator piscidefendens TaxID=2715756 RepID=UPI001E392D57|nr:hypothetical protein [Cochlodiniinecator piscidefendens]
MKHTELNLAERRAIEDLLYRNVKVTEIARRIIRHRAIKRNFLKDDELNRPLFAGDPEVRILNYECGNRYSPEVRERAVRMVFPLERSIHSRP